MNANKLNLTKLNKRNRKNESKKKVKIFHKEILCFPTGQNTTELSRQPNKNSCLIFSVKY